MTATNRFRYGRYAYSNMDMIDSGRRQPVKSVGDDGSSYSTPPSSKQQRKQVKKKIVFETPSDKPLHQLQRYEHHDGFSDASSFAGGAAGDDHSVYSSSIASASSWSPASTRNHHHAPSSSSVSVLSFNEKRQKKLTPGPYKTAKYNDGRRSKNTAARPQQQQDFGADDASSLFGDLRLSSSEDSSSTEVSVSKLKGWLDDFGKQQQSHYQQNATVGKVPDGVHLRKAHKTITAKPSAAVTAARNNHHLHATAANVRSGGVLNSKLTTTPSKPKGAATPLTSNTTSRMVNGPSVTPVRFKPRHRNADVQATNSGYASVKQLASWLADDPTTSDKVTRGHVRRGMNIIQKSRAFEKDLEHVIVEETPGMRIGGVATKTKKWMSMDIDQNEADDPAIENDHDEGLKPEQDAVMDDEVSVSVSDKKKWLANAFGGAKQQQQQPSITTQSDTGITSSSSVMDKKKWLQGAFSSSGQQEQPTHLSVAAPIKTSVKAKSEVVGSFHDADKRARVKKAFAARRASRQSLDGSENDSKEEPRAEIVRDEEMDFAAARQLLVSRSQQNGNPVNVVSAVHGRKAKFERWEKDLKKGTEPHGRLKTTWADNNSNSSGGAYTKAYVPDVAPKKSFEELP